jgi:ParB family chromosome partitioning protein
MGDTGRVPVHLILPNPDQPRSDFDPKELQALAQSMRERSQIVPIVVERAAGKQFILVDGERRLRAAKLLGWTTIDAVVRKAVNHGGRERLVDALVANLQRADLGPIEEARAYAVLHRQLRSVREVAEKLGVKETLISERLALLKLAEPVQQMFQAKELPLDGMLVHRLLKLTPAEQVRAAATGAARGWTAHALRKVAAKTARGPKASALEAQPKKAPRKMAEEAADAKVTGHFDALALVHDWEALPRPMIETARKTCQACDLYPGARREICERCPLPDFLVRFKLAYIPMEAK